MEEEIRAAAFQWLKEKSSESGRVFRRADLQQGFEFRGQRITLVGPTGIWIPKGFESPISISTTTSGPYDDGFTDDGILRYSYRGTDPQHRDNQALRKAFYERIPLIYFQAIKPGLYVACKPHLLLMDEVGYENLTPEQATLFFQLVNVRYESGSIIMTTNKTFGKW